MRNERLVLSLSLLFGIDNILSRYLLVDLVAGPLSGPGGPETDGEVEPGKGQSIPSVPPPIGEDPELRETTGTLAEYQPPPEPPKKDRNISSPVDEAEDAPRGEAEYEDPEPKGEGRDEPDEEPIATSAVSRPPRGMKIISIII